MPLRNNKIRWNPWCLMLDQAITHLKTPILQTVHEEPGLAKDFLSHTDWLTLTNIRDFLQAFYHTTKATEGRRATLDMVLPSLDFLALRFEQAIEKYEAIQDQFMISCLQAGWSKILKYWHRTDRSSVYIAAIVLDPTLKWSYFDDWDPNWQPAMRHQMRAFWKTYRPHTITQERPQQRVATNKFTLWMQQRRSTVQYISDELDHYLNEPCLIQNDKTALIGGLYRSHVLVCPISRMAIDMFSISAMSSEAERMFSAAKHTLNEQRMSCSIETIGLLECLKLWFKLGIYTEEDLHTINCCGESTTSGNRPIRGLEPLNW